MWLCVLSPALVIPNLRACGSPARDDSRDASRAAAVPAAGEVRIAFIGDQGWEPRGSHAGPRAVLELIRDEGTDLVLHQGDFDYMDDPAAWMRQVDDVLGPDMPYLASVGNHDADRWNGPDGYRALLEARATRQGITWTGTLGEEGSVVFRGIRILFGAPGVFDDDPDDYARYFAGALASAAEPWRVCSWHKDMQDMQVGGKLDETGWGVYEACRRGGAIIATGHEHSYSRTYLLSDMERHTVASRSDTLALAPGRTFAFVSGLGGKTVRAQLRGGPWWASVYTATQGATFGALFGVFNEGGRTGLAHFYFKNIRGEVVDEFWVRAP